MSFMCPVLDFPLQSLQRTGAATNRLEGYSCPFHQGFQYLERGFWEPHTKSASGAHVSTTDRRRIEVGLPQDFVAVELGISRP